MLNTALSSDNLAALAGSDYDHVLIVLLESKEFLTPEDHFRVGESLVALNRFAEASAHLMEAWESGHLESGDLLSTSMLSSDRHDELAALLESALLRGVSDPTIRLQGTLRSDLGDADGAEELLRRAIGAGDMKAHSELGGLLMEAGDIDQAETEFRMAHQHGVWRGTQGLARIATLRSDPEAVNLSLSLVVEGYDQALLDLARACKAVGHVDLAIASYRDAGDFQLEGSREELVELYIEMGMIEEAREEFRELEELTNSFKPAEVKRIRRALGL